MSAKKKNGGGIGRIARVIDAAMKDADLARKHASDPAFQKDVRKDRRATLSSFRTVQHALEDRERLTREQEKKARR